MSALAYIEGVVIPAALSMLDARMDTPAARAMIVAIGLQESGFEHRAQEGGPARGFHQFEVNGVRGVLTHHTTSAVIAPILKAMAYDNGPSDIHEVLADNDILDCVFARLLLWTHPSPLPERSYPNAAWDYYKELWRPGTPRRDSWDAFYAQAWGLVAP